MSRLRAGDTFSRWTVVLVGHRLPSGRKMVPAVVCRCACGVTRSVMRSNLVGGLSRSCGCLQRERAATSGRNSRRHGMSRAPEYHVWNSMRERCGNPSHSSYCNYGGRGIRVCERWASFDNFIDDMGARPSTRHSIDRIDVNGNYEPGNCRWATNLEQQRNTRSNVRLTFRGETATLPEWAERYGINQPALRARLGQGWDMERALTTPLRQRRRSA